MSGWRNRLARAERPADLLAQSALLAEGEKGRGTPSSPPIGTNGAIGIGEKHDKAEREALAEHYRRPADPAPYTPERADPLRDGLLSYSLARLPGGAPMPQPPPGAWCRCCGRFDRSGGRWWRPNDEPRGWRCMTCHPPIHLREGAIVEITT